MTMTAETTREGRTRFSVLPAGESTNGRLQPGQYLNLDVAPGGGHWHIAIVENHDIDGGKLSQVNIDIGY